MTAQVGSLEQLSENISIHDGYSDTSCGGPSGAAMNFVNVQGLGVVGNEQKLQLNRTPPMRVARWDSRCTDVVYQDNTPDTG